MKLRLPHTITVAHSGFVALYYNSKKGLEATVNFDDLKDYYELDTVEQVKALYKKVSENMGRIHGSEKIVHRLQIIAGVEKFEL
jgi:hypothetical protein